MATKVATPVVGRGIATFRTLPAGQIKVQVSGFRIQAGKFFAET
jgi:hypothetical protein